MGLPEIVSMKVALAREIERLVQAFERETGTTVSQMYLERYSSTGLSDGSIHKSAPVVKLSVEI